MKLAEADDPYEWQNLGLKKEKEEEEEEEEGLKIHF